MNKYTPINVIRKAEQPCNHLAQHFHPSGFHSNPFSPSEGDTGDGETMLPTANKLTCFYMLLSCAFWMNRVRGGAAKVLISA